MWITFWRCFKNCHTWCTICFIFPTNTLFTSCTSNSITTINSLYQYFAMRTSSYIILLHIYINRIFITSFEFSTCLSIMICCLLNNNYIYILCMNYNIVSNIFYMYILVSFRNELLDNLELNKKQFMLHDPINLIILK